MVHLLGRCGKYRLGLRRIGYAGALLTVAVLAFRRI